MPKGEYYPREVKVRAARVAAKIRSFHDLDERRAWARWACLEAVKRDPRFPERLFLRDCGVPVSDVQGPALRVKKTKHHLRIGDCAPLTEKEKNRIYRRNAGIPELDCREPGDDPLNCCVAHLITPLRDDIFPWLRKMF